MAIPNTAACIQSKGKRIFGKDCISKKFISRINSVDKLFCDSIKLLNNSEIALSKYCTISSDINPSSSSSSSSSPCPLVHKAIIPDYSYLITVNDLDKNAYDLLDLLENEACFMYRKVKDFEKLAINDCNPSPSSSSSEPESSSSSSFSPSSSAPSSSAPSSSLSSSLSSSAPSSSSAQLAPLSVHVASYCSAVPGLSMELFAGVAPLGYSDAYYTEFGTSSSSSGALPSSSSSSSGIGSVVLRHISETNIWQIVQSPYGVIAEKSGNEYSPVGAYSFLYGPCAGESIFIV